MRFLLPLCLLLLATACDGTQTAGMNGAESKLYAQAKTKEKSGDKEAAATLYRDAIKASTGSIGAHLALGELLRNQGKGTEAATVLQQALAVQPDNAEALKELGNAYVASGDGTKALDAFDRSIAIKNTDARAHNGRGVALDLLKRHAEAQKSYRKGMDLVPANKGYIENNLALSLIATKNYPEAIRLLETLAGTDEADAQTRQNLAMAYALSGDEARAREWSRKDLSDAETEANIKFYRSLREARSKAPVTKSKPAAKAVPKKTVKK